MIGCRILSIDGGGIRGIVPATLLRLFEAGHKLAVRDHFEVFAGTSTGSLIAAALASGKFTCSALCDLYQLAGGSIFRPKGSSWTPDWLRGNLSPKYDAAHLKQLLEQKFEGMTFGQIDKSKRLIITAFDVDNRRPMIFDSHHAEYERIALVDACLASSAAPTYFSAHQLNIDGATYRLIDGGITANDPAAIALGRALARFRPAQMFLCSIGTGNPLRAKHAEVIDWGRLRWSTAIADVLFRGNSGAMEDVIRSILPADNYVRIQPTLEPDLASIDDATDKNISLLVTHSRDHYGQSEVSAVWKRVATVLRAGVVAKQHSAWQIASPSAEPSQAAIAVTPDGEAVISTDSNNAEELQRLFEMLDKQMPFMARSAKTLQSLVEEMSVPELRLLHNFLALYLQKQNVDEFREPT